jgi:hypothetical protein
VNLQKFLRRAGGAAFLTAIAATGSTALAQVQPAPTLVINRPNWSKAVAGSNNLYCAGYVQSSPINTANRLIGAVEEQDGFSYSQDDYVYLNMGSNSGAHVGDIFAVVRPRGQVTSHWSNKGKLGFYVQEVGALEIVRVKSNVSVARIRTSCDTFLLGDLVQPIEARVSPATGREPVIDRFADPSGKAKGRIFMGRDNQETLTRDQIVYIDLGREDSVQIGDRLMVYRPLGTGNPLKPRGDETVSARDSGFQGLTYRGGKFSNQAPRKSGDTAEGHVVTTEKAKKGRPDDIRKIVGEAVILNVKERTATAVITKTVQEVHTGDWVEVQ